MAEASQTAPGRYRACGSSNEVNAVAKTTGALNLAYGRVLNNAELTAHIFQYLRDLTYEDAGIVDKDDHVPHYPRSWRQFFARLALISRTFFHASIAILWEKMDTVGPYFYVLLPADEADQDGTLCNPPAYATNLITTEHWRRFEIYASKTKVLAMNRPGIAPMSNGWLLHLAMSKARPDPIFPQLNHLIITSDDNLSLFVAHSSAPYAKAVTIIFDEHSDEASEEPGASLAATICGNTRDVARLTQVRLVSPSDSQYALRNICLSPSITNLHVCIGPNAHKDDFARIAMLYDVFPLTLKALMIRQNIAPNDSAASDPDMWPTSLRTQDHIARAANLPHLTALRISCNALTHFLAAQSLSPTSLTTLRLEVKVDAFKGQVLLLPLVLAIYTARNPSLIHLEIVCPVSEDLTPESIAPRRNEWQYMDVRLLYTGLKGLQHLATLNIVKIHFLGVDVLDRLFDIGLELPALQVLALSPRPISTMEGDALMLPPLSRLEEIARKSMSLVTLELAMDFADIPIIPNGLVPSTRLENLRIYELPEDSLFMESFSTDELLSLARYLDKLFPNLKSLTAGWEKGSDQWKLWDYMEKLVQSFQDFRAEARRELQQSTSAQVHL